MLILGRDRRLTQLGSNRGATVIWAIARYRIYI